MGSDQTKSYEMYRLRSDKVLRNVWDFFLVWNAHIKSPLCFETFVPIKRTNVRTQGWVHKRSFCADQVQGQSLTLLFFVSGCKYVMEWFCNNFVQMLNNLMLF